MGCNAAARLAAQLVLTKEELEKLKKDIIASSELRITLESDLIQVRNSANDLVMDNERLKHELIFKLGEAGGSNASVFESAREEQERLHEWIRMEIKEGNILLTSILKMRGADDGSGHDREIKKFMDALDESDYNSEKLKEFSQWKARLMEQEFVALMDDRATWVQFLTLYEDEIRAAGEVIDRESGGKARPQLADLKGRMMRLPSAAQPLARLKAMREIERALGSLRVNSTTEIDSETKTLIGRQAEELKVLSQRLAAQRKLEEERKSSAEKELSLKEVHIKHLENKVKDLARPVIADVDLKAREKELERLKAEVARVKEAKREINEKIANQQQANEDLMEQMREKNEELEKMQA